MPKHDIADLKARLPLEDFFRQQGVELERAGREYRALCPFHSESTASFTLCPEKQKYFCFGCGANGDHLDAIQALHGVDASRAIEMLADMVGGTVAEPTAAKAPRKQRPRKPSPWVTGIAPPDEPPPATLPKKTDAGWVKYPVVAAWPYRDLDGNLHGYTCRIEPTPGHKEVIPLIWQTSTESGEQRWNQGALPEPRLLYGTELLLARPDATILLVEGEKAADAARRLTSARPIIAMTWPGGCKAVDKADWSLLAGRRVACWPDADNQADKRTELLLSNTKQPGMAAMLRISKALTEHGASVRIVDLPPVGTLPNGWDLADAEQEGWDCAKLSAEIKARSRDPVEIKDPEPVSQPETAPPLDYVPEVSDQPFRCLGWNRNEAFYLPTGSRQVVAMSPSAHNKLNLLALAPLHWWMSTYHTDKKTGDPVDWTMAADSLIRMSQAQGIFDEEMIRGRGAWWDSGRYVVHLGSEVVIDRLRYPVTEVPSRYIYEASKPTRLAFSDPLGNADAYQLVKICEGLRWERPVYGLLLAGFVFIAPVCGALDWRPHVWITGEPGSGKTTVMQHIVHKVLHRNGLFFQGDTTEAAVRQSLGSDAVPVIFDEFESERKKSASRVEDIMALITQASSETGGVLAKGGAGGKATMFRIRSMFCFSSVAVAIKQAAARSRITVLSLRPAEPETEAGIAQYNAMMTLIADTLTPAYVDSLQARAVHLIPEIRANAVVFAEAAATALRTRRFGDQIGTLLAGAYALHSSGRITREDAKKWIEMRDWSEEAGDQQASDKEDCLSYITAHVLTVQSANGERAERSIGELAAVVDGKATDPVLRFVEDVEDALGRSGIIVRGGDMIVATGHKYIERMLGGTQWEASYSRTLLRLEGAQKMETTYFKGARKRGVAVPLSHIF